MTRQDLSADAARLLREAMNESPALAPASREQELATILALSEAIRSGARARRGRRARVGGMALAALVLLGAGGWWARDRATRQPGTPAPLAWSASGRGELRSGGVHVPLSGARTRVDEGARLVAGAAEAIQVEGQTGTRMALHGEMVVVEEGARSVFHLSRGTVSAKVVKLEQHERFLVRTLDVEIEVRGTAFDVTLAPVPRCGTTTRVEVTEGLVAVRNDGRETLVRPGEVWPRCEQVPVERPIAARPGDTSPSAPTPSITTARGAPLLSAVPRSAPSSAPPAAPVSPSVPATRAAEPSVEPTAAVALAATTLAAQNDLFQEAMGYKRQGSAGLAVTRLERLIAEYPASPLRESATVERMKLLDGMDHPAGRRAAQEYLGQWPGGFAVADAQRILARP